MNRCGKYLENLSAYLDGEISENDTKDIKKHLLKCEKCSEELSVLKTIISSLSELEEELPDGFETSLHKRLEEAGTKSGVNPCKSGKMRLFSQIAAGFVIVLCLGFVIRAGLMRTGGKSAGPAAADMASVSAQQSTAEDGFGEAGAMSARSMIIEASGSSNRGTGSADPEMEYYAMDDSTENHETTSESMDGIQKESGTNEAMIAYMEPEPSQTVSYALKAEGQDTLVKITAEDAQSVLKAIIEIESGLNQEEQHSNIAGLNKTLDAVNTEIYDGNQIEVKMLYLNNETWHEFLTKMEAVFPEMHVQSVPKAEDIEYIRIAIEEK